MPPTINKSVPIWFGGIAVQTVVVGVVIDMRQPGTEKGKGQYVAAVGEIAQALTLI